MALPIPANTTCNIYRAGQSPPAAPDVSNVAVYLTGDFTRRLETGEGLSAEVRYTHVMSVDLSVDIRDGFVHFSNVTNPDTVYVPGNDGQKFTVVFVERRGRGLSTDHKRVYLHREELSGAGAPVVPPV